MVFYCNGKHGVCDKKSSFDSVCPINCEYADGNGGYNIETNGDRIRAMSDEELAKEFAAMASYCAPGDRPPPENCSPLGCINCWIDWLKQPAKEET